MRNKSRGQSITEYSICLGVILLAFVGTNIYVKRGLQARYRDAVSAVTSKVADTGHIAVKPQYEPYYANATNTVNMVSTLEQSISEYDSTGKIINPGKVNRRLSGTPTTVESTNVEAVGAVGDEVEQGSAITKVQ